MRIVVCLSIEDELLPVEAIARLVSLRDAEVDLLHVIDEAEAEFERSMRIGLLRPRGADVRAADHQREALEVIRRCADALLSDRGAAWVSASMRRGRPEREIVMHLREQNADLCVVGRREEWAERHATGPRSVGRVARFVCDHAPCAVLLLR